jgi:hypothetical protein
LVGDVEGVVRLPGVVYQDFSPFRNTEVAVKLSEEAPAYVVVIIEKQRDSLLAIHRDELHIYHSNPELSMCG